MSVFAEFAPPSIALKHAFQTNATLVTEGWAAFFAQVGASVSVSIDGPAWIHDRARMGRKGEHTHSRVMRGVRLLRDADISPSVICVLAAEGIQRPDEIFWFFEESGFHRIAFDFEEIIGCHDTTSFGRAAEHLAERFIRRYIELNRENKSAQSVREIDQVAVRLFSANQSGLFASVYEPFGHIAVDFAGNYWTYSPELGFGPNGQDYFLGNCKTDSLDTVAETAGFRDVRSAVDRGIAECRRSCSYFAICGGGSPAHKLAATGRLDGSETLFCRLAVKSPTNALTKMFMDAFVQSTT